MIKINLATRRTPSAAGGTGEGAGGGLFGFLKRGSGGGGGGVSIDFDELRELPLKQLVLAIIVAFGANWVLEDLQKKKLDELDAAVATGLAQQAKIKKSLDATKEYETIKVELEADEQVLRTKIETVRKLVEGRDEASRLLRLVADLTPKDVWLTGLQSAKDIVTIRGESTDYNLISEFMRKLEESVYLKNLKLVGTVQKDDPDFGPIATFEISAEADRETK